MINTERNTERRKRSSVFSPDSYNAKNMKYIKPSVKLSPSRYEKDNKVLRPLMPPYKNIKYQVQLMEKDGELYTLVDEKSIIDPKFET